MDVTFGGVQLSTMMSMMSSSVRLGADQLSYAASKTAKIGSYARREQDWAFQSNLAAGEITQIFKQLRGAQIREAIAEREWRNHQEQIKHTKEIERFLNGENTPIGDRNHKKTSSQALYTWLKRETRALHNQACQFACDIARKAERLQHELGNSELTYLQFGYLAGKEGLLAGEKLYLDLKRMDMAFHDLNQREYELTKHVSLLQVNPQALLQLRTTGRCTFVLPEELFDDCPGHYFRRIKAVALSVPCVAGPYTSINCTLTLLKSSIRTNALVGDDGYARTGADDTRFSDYFGTLQSIVTSTGQNDSGLFETNLRDERYLPFELSGTISQWQLQLPADPSKADPQQFNYDTISDVILHIRYTSREGGALLRKAAVSNLTERINEAQAAGSVRLFSIRHDFPAEWAKFVQVKIGGDTKTAQLEMALRQEHFPFWSQGRIEAVKRVDLFAKAAKRVDIAALADGANKKALVKDSSLGGLWRGQLPTLPTVDTSAPLSIKFNLNFVNNMIEDLWLVVAWGKSE